MAKLILTIDLDGDAIQSYPEKELADIFMFLRDCAMTRPNVADFDGMTVRDSNGNTVGNITVDGFAADEDYGYFGGGDEM